MSAAGCATSINGTLKGLLKLRRSGAGHERVNELSAEPSASELDALVREEKRLTAVESHSEAWADSISAGIEPEIVAEAALATALKEGTIAAAGLDVFADEPHVTQALLDAPNTSLLPHVGSASEHTRRAMADLSVDNLVSWFTEGKAITAVPETADIARR